MYSKSILMDLDLKYIVFFGVSVFIMLVLGGYKIPDNIDLEDPEIIVDIEILNVALSDLSQLEK